MEYGYTGSGVANDSADDNVIQPFQLEISALRGRSVRLGSVLNEVLEPHGYPEPVAHLVAETMTLALLLSSMLKYDGIFTLQVQGQGPVSMLVADVTHGGVVRGCASFDAERLAEAQASLSLLKPLEGSNNHLAHFLGEGYIAFTVDQGNGADRYQGIVELKGASLVDCVQHYFNQSEQIGTGIKMAVGKRGAHWRAGAIMLQRLPEDMSNADPEASEARADDWRRAMALLDTCKDDEFLDPALHSNALLTRLFHEEGVRVFEPVDVEKGCRCDQDRVERILVNMSDDDLDEMSADGVITMRCEFCSSDFVFDLNNIRSKIASEHTDSP